MKRLHLSLSEKKVAGVCGGLAEYFDIDPSIVRLAFVLIALCTAIAPMLLFYLIAWIILPSDSGQNV